MSYSNGKKSLLSSYKPDLESAFMNYHKDHPITIEWKVYPAKDVCGKLRINVKNNFMTPHMIQLCYSSKTTYEDLYTETTNYNLIMCDRQIITDISKYQPPYTSEIVNTVSILILNIETKEWWTSVI